MITDIMHGFLLYWPVIIVGVMFLYLSIEYRRHRQEKQDPCHAQSPNPPVLPDKLILARGFEQVLDKNSRQLLVAIIVILIALLFLPVVTAIQMHPDKSWLELLQTMAGKLAGRPTAVINIFIMLFMLGIIPIYLLTINKNERLILTGESITYIPLFTGRLQGLVPGWSLRWDEVADIRLGRGLMRGQLKISPRQGKTQILMAHVWRQVDAPIDHETASLFSRLRFRYKLQHDTRFALQHLPLLRYIQQKLDFVLDTGKTSDLDFDLLKHTATRRVVVIIFGLIVYILLDSMANSETYTRMPPLAGFIVSGGVLALCLMVWLWNKSIPRGNVWGLAIMTGAVFAVAMYPGLLRLNQLSTTKPLQAYQYRYAGNYEFTPGSKGLPVIVLRKDEYWYSINQGDDYSFVLRKGGLGFYQLDMDPVYARMRPWYCRKYAKGDVQKLSQCDAPK